MAEIALCLIAFGVFESLCLGSGQNICEQPSKPGDVPVCCTFYFYNGTDCIECPSGYYGLECNVPCNYPSYGPRCNTICNCSENDCDYVHGCLLTMDMPRVKPNAQMYGET
ncbi:multiple epidermal growth factor-like domains protein 6 [Saccostrea cucullata]|uniref:multiple epidermal growth factor-like domains protein 6 n=1 Tax=Saccostrea cuccullata TaxID=36930 RepID=UPI002ED0F6EA